MRRKYNHQTNFAVGSCSINHVATSLRNSVYRTPSVVDEFYAEKSIDSDTGLEVTSYSNPLYVLFNQQRLDELSPMALKQWLDQMNQAGNSELKKLREKLSEKELHQLVRSRYIQHPADLQAYLESINADVEKLNADIKAMQEEQAAQQEEQAAQQASQQSSTSNTE